MCANGENLQVKLTEVEAALAARIDFGNSGKRHDTESWRAVADAMDELMQSLLARQAIPEVRRRYFSDPALNIGGHGASRSEIFERNGTRGRAIFRHPHFVRYLRYFLYGPDLPSPLQEGFQQKMRGLGTPSSSDRMELVKFARELARSFGVDARDSSEEFFKLALECGLDLDDARAIRDGVRKLR